jgi:hypothetical protein
MIDTDKYEGHTPAPWAITNDGIVGVTEPKDVTLHVFSGCYSETDAQLIADAPLLLEEVKRLRDLVEFAIAAIDSNHCYMGEEAQVDLRDYLKEMIE